LSQQPHGRAATFYNLKFKLDTAVISVLMFSDSCVLNTIQ